MLLLISIILVYNRVLISDSAPKLGHINFDPLSNEAKLSEMSLKDIIFSLMNNRYKTASPEEEKVLITPSKLKFRRADDANSTKKSCSGYEYNDTICKTVDDRVVCGYDKNKGDVKNESIDVGNGCRIRGDRLECGYVNGPFNYTRRPPANDKEDERDETDDDEDHQKEHKIKKLRLTVDPLHINFKKKSITSSTQPTTVIKVTTKYNNISNHQNISFGTKTDISKPSTLRMQSNITSVNVEVVTKKIKKRCVLKNDSIFCNTINKS